MKNLTNQSVLGVTITNTTLQEVLENVYFVLNKDRSGRSNNTKVTPDHSRVLPIYTINPEFVVLAHRLKAFQTVLNRAFIAVPDGIGILFAGLLKGKPFKERVTGIQLVYALSQSASEHDFTVGFLGGNEHAATKTEEYFKKRFPHFTSWSDTGPFIEIDEQQASVKDQFSISDIIKIDQNSDNIKNLLTKISKTDILFVAFGAPKQEFFIEYLKSCLDRKLKTENRKLIAVGVGGSLDEISGISLKTPLVIERVGLKWLFRLTTEPWRWKRQLRLVKFLYLLAIRK